MRLNDLLTDIPGVQAADVQLVDGEVRSVRVELEPGADEQQVGGAIREVLAAYGYRSRVAPPRGKVEPLEPPPPPGPEMEPTGDEPDEAEPVAETGGGSALEAPEQERAGGEAIRAVEVVETLSGIRVAVEGSDGTVVSRYAARDHTAEAVVDAVAELAGCSTAVRVLDVERREDGAVLVVVEFGDGRRAAGAALRRSGWNYAVAEAAWRALTHS